MSSRTATVRSRFEDADTAETLAAAIRPDNTSEIDTRVDDSGIVTTVERGTTGGLQSTLDDYVVNLAVAEQIVQIANRQRSDTNTEDNS